MVSLGEKYSQHQIKSQVIRISTVCVAKLRNRNWTKDGIDGLPHSRAKVPSRWLADSQEWNSGFLSKIAQSMHNFENTLT